MVPTYYKQYVLGAQSLSRVWLFVTQRTVASQAPLSIKFSRWENWSGLPIPTPGDLPNPGIKLTSLASCLLHWQVDSLSLSHQGSPRLLFLKWISDRTFYCTAQEILLNILWQPNWEKNLKKNRYVYMYNWITLLYTWNERNIVNQLYSNIKLKKSLKK